MDKIFNPYSAKILSFCQRQGPQNIEKYYISFWILILLKFEDVLESTCVKTNQILKIFWDIWEDFIYVYDTSMFNLWIHF